MFGVSTLNNKQDTGYKTVQLKGKNAKLLQFHINFAMFYFFQGNRGEPALGKLQQQALYYCCQPLHVPFSVVNLCCSNLHSDLTLFLPIHCIFLF